MLSLRILTLNFNKMKVFLKNLGIILILLGFGATILSVVQDVKSNVFLLLGFVLIIVGLLGYIILNKVIS